MQPRLLDLFCGAGGCAKGYYDAGFEVVGVDINPQPHYPFEFIQADALTFPLHGFDVIHASPPCQAYSSITNTARENGISYPDYLEIMRNRFLSQSTPWIIENVPGAPVLSGIVLCGSMFGIRVRRHRHFESSHLLFAPGNCKHDNNFVSVYGGETQRSKINPAYTGKRCGVASKLRTRFPHEQGQQAMGIDWMNKEELSQAIPPVYTEWVGTQVKELL